MVVVRWCNHPKAFQFKVREDDGPWNTGSSINWCTFCGALERWNPQGTRRSWHKPLRYKADGKEKARASKSSKRNS